WAARPIRPAKPAGTSPRLATTWRICRLASHRRRTTVNESAAANSSVKPCREGVVSVKVLRRGARVPAWTGVWWSIADGRLAESGGRRARAAPRAMGECASEKIMSQSLPQGPDENRLVWVDMEMTGLNPAVDRIIEIAIVITDSDLAVLTQSE